MSLTTIMSNAGLSGYAIAGMLAFLVAFASILAQLWLKSRRGGLAGDERLPLDDGHPVAPPVMGHSSREGR